jgi:hypothetical protein
VRQFLKVNPLNISDRGKRGKENGYLETFLKDES